MATKAIYECEGNRVFATYKAARQHANAIGSNYIHIRTTVGGSGDEFTRFAYKGETIEDEPYNEAFAVADPATGRHMLAFSREGLDCLVMGEPGRFIVCTYRRNGDELEEIEDD